ncbi:hypothetical protein [Flavicella sp.]|uniref:hypothetical protein n=1 Tax=Flavicella sp. TaxID=2957742 RepID=UPI00301B243E
MKKALLLFIAFTTISLGGLSAQSFSGLTKALTSSSSETQQEALLNQSEIQNLIAAKLGESPELTDEAINYLKNNAETKSEISAVIAENPTSKEKIMDYITSNPELLSKAMDYIKSKPELMEKALKLIGM